MPDPDEAWNDLHDYSEFDGRFNDPCPMCFGTGEINALTDPPPIFVGITGDCPLCDGSGEAP